jgi:predicted Zn-dependent peptidase
VAAGLFIRGGAQNVTGETAGIERLMLEAASGGSKNFPREVLRRELSKIGTTIGASSGNDYSVLSLASTRPNFDRSWEIFSDIILNPSFTDESIRAASERIAAGLREQETNTDNFLQVLQSRVIYANHPYANDVDGTIDTISRFTSKDLTNYHKKVMQSSQLLLVIVGDVDAKDLEKRITSTLGKLPRGSYKQQPLPAIDFSKPTLDVTQRTLPTNYVQGVFNAPSLNNPDYYAMRMAISILSTLIFIEVREKRQLSYAPSAEMSAQAANTANIYVTAVDANTAIKVMLDQVKRLKNDTFPKEALSSISEHYLTMYYMGQETNSAQAAELAKYELIGGGWRNSFEFFNHIRDVTPQDIQTVASKYMKNIRFIVVGNPSAIDKNIFLQAN